MELLFSPIIFYKDAAFNGTGSVLCTYPGVMPNMYDITLDGEVYSHHYSKYLAKTEDKDGYYRVCLVGNNGKSVTESVHRLVAWEFVVNPRPELYTAVNHIDCDNKNNYFTNLEWCTPFYNSNQASRHGLYQHGEDHHCNVYPETFVRSICELFERGLGVTDTIRALGIEKSDPRYMGCYYLASDLHRRKGWSHITCDYNY